MSSSARVRPYGLVLAGGGLKGLLHFPILHGLGLVVLPPQAPPEMAPPTSDQRPECIVGASAGTIAGYLLAIGLRPLEIFARVLVEDMPSRVAETLSYVNFLGGRGLLDWGPIDTFLRTCAEERLGPGGPELTFAQLFGRTGVDLVCIITNLGRARSEYWGYRTHPDVRVLDAVRISCGHPFLLLPVMGGGGDWLGDGGILDNLGLKFAARHRPDLDFLAITTQKARPDPEFVEGGSVTPSLWTMGSMLRYSLWIHDLLAENVASPGGQQAHVFVPHWVGEEGPRPAEVVVDADGERGISAVPGIHILRGPGPAGRTHVLVRFPTMGVGTAPGEHQWLHLFYTMSEWARRTYAAALRCACPGGILAVSQRKEKLE